VHRYPRAENAQASPIVSPSAILPISRPSVSTLIVSAVKRTRHTSPEPNELRFGTQWDVALPALSHPVQGQGDPRKNQLEAIANDEPAYEDAREAARHDLYLEFPKG
jgi:hypothetical protein